MNPQAIGGARMAAFVLQPNVAEFLDVVMHDGRLEFRLEEAEVAPGSAAVGSTIASVRADTGALVLAVRSPAGGFATNPAQDVCLQAGQVVIAVGTRAQLVELDRYVRHS